MGINIKTKSNTKMVDAEPKVTEVKDTADQGHDMDHGHDHGHDAGPGAPMQKGERKARKALAKVGMKSLAGVTRVTIKKKDGIVFVINNPTVMRSGEDGNQFAVFGEITIDDPVNRVNMQKAQAMQA